MKLKTLLVILIGLTTQLQAQVWTNRYNGQGDFSDRYTAVLTDASGNVFLAGSTVITNNNQDILLTKLDAAGNTVWRTIYNAPSSGVDAALAMAFDASGNIYITGYAKFSVSATDIVTIKFNAAGVIQWTANYGFTTDQYEQGNSVVVDAAGNVYVAGQSDPDSTSTVSDDYVVIKYNAAGVQQWVQRTNGTGNGVDRPSKIVLDAANNPIVTGRSDNLVNYDYLTVKYNTATGAPLWSVRYDRTHNDWATDIMVHPTNGNIYVTGRSKNIDFDYATVCYNSAGVVQWSAIYDNGIGDNRATALGMDATGNIYVTGQSDVGTTAINYDITTVKYNSAGTQQWVRTYSGTALNDDIPNAMVVTSAGVVHITGQIDADATATVVNDFATLKYDTNGTLLWSQVYNNATSTNDIPRALAVDSSGNVLVAGSAELIPNRTAICVKYNAAGTSQWVNTFNEVGDNTDKPNAIFVDAAGNSFIAGYVVEYGADRNFALQKVDPNGNTLWVRTLNGTSVGSSDAATCLAQDNLGNTYVAGYTHNKGTSSDLTVAKFDTNGNQLWAVNYDFVTEVDRALAIALDGSNNVYVTGRSDSDTSNLVSNDDIITIKYNTNGVLLWSMRYNGAGNLIDTGRAIKVGTTGNVYVAGRSWSGTHYDTMVIKYNTTGTLQWVNSYHGFGNEELFYMDMDAAENVYVGGNADNATATNTDILVQKINATGVTQWTKRYDGAALGNDVVDGLKLDSAQNCIVLGATDTDTSATTLNNDICLIKYDTNGNTVWSLTQNGTQNGDDQGIDITVDTANNIFITNMANGPTNYDFLTFKVAANGAIGAPFYYNGTNNDIDIPQAITFKNNAVYVTGSSIGVGTQSDFLTLKYDSNQLTNPTFTENTNRFKLYPNPAHQQVNIAIDAENSTDLSGMQVQITDLFGRIVGQQTITDFTTTLTIEMYPSGVYIIQIVQNNTLIDSKKLLIN